jgi:hypothetical protein
MIPIIRRSYCFRLSVFAVALAASSAVAMDHVTMRRDDSTRTIDGRIELIAKDGGLLFLARDGLLWRVLPTEIVKRSKDDLPFRGLPPDQMAKSVLAELPKGFEVYQTAHYLICHNTSRAYAQWCGGLFERLYLAFRNNWSRQGIELVEPQFRLVAIIFADKASYVKYSSKELGDAADSIIGYYNMDTNRMVMYDLVGASMQRSGRSFGDMHIRQFLASENAAAAVTTIVHETTHQIAFNCGLHQRLSDCPKWFSEGIAMYCETPDLSRGKGWAGLGVVNRGRLLQFQQYCAKPRVANSLKSLVSSDERLVDPKQVVDAYSESWALTYFLIHKHSKQYLAYLRLLAQKKPLVYDEKSTRLAEFENHFGKVERVDAEFMNYMQTYMQRFLR